MDRRLFWVGPGCSFLGACWVTAKAAAPAAPQAQNRGNYAPSATEGFNGGFMRVYARSLTGTGVAMDSINTEYIIN
jgi:hypothetical protein